MPGGGVRWWWGGVMYNISGAAGTDGLSVQYSGAMGWSSTDWSLL